MTTAITREDALAHFGVKGMKWGVIRKKLATASENRQRNRKLNKEFVKGETAKRDAEIDAARDRYKTSARKNYLDAKAQYKLDKKTIGSAAARAKFNKVKQKNIDDYEMAQQAKSGRETTLAVLSTVGGLAIGTLLLTASRPGR